MLVRLSGRGMFNGRIFPSRNPVLPLSASAGWSTPPLAHFNVRQQYPNAIVWQNTQECIGLEHGIACWLAQLLALAGIKNEISNPPVMVLPVCKKFDGGCSSALLIVYLPVFADLLRG